MKTITRTQFSGTTEQLVARVTAFNDALVAHASTVGIPAPREEDWIEELARSGEPVEVEPEPVKPTVEELRAADVDAKRAAALFAIQRAAIEAAAAAQRAKEDAMLDLAIADPNASQEVKDYAALRDTAQAPVTR